MSEQLWVAVIVGAAWAAMPISIIIACTVFDKDVVKPGQDPFHH